MAITDQTYPIQRMNFGNSRSRGGERHILGVSYGHTSHRVRAAAATSAAIVAATATSASLTTVITPTGQPDVPRALSVTVAATTAADIKGSTITITGVNVEGKVITDTFAVTNDTAATINGTKAFKRVTNISVPAQDGASVTVAVNTLNLVGLNHRLPTGTTTANVRVVSTSSVRDVTAANLGANGVQTVQSVPSAIAVDPAFVEANTITPATAPDGTFSMTIHYYYVKWVLQPTNDGAKIANTTNYGAE